MKYLLRILLLFSCLYYMSGALIQAKTDNNVYNVCGVISDVKYDRYFLVEKDNKYGVASEYGKMVIPCRYDKIRISKNDNRYVICETCTQHNTKGCMLYHYKGDGIANIFPCVDIQPGFGKFLYIDKDFSFMLWDKNTDNLHPVKVADISDNTECNTYLIMCNALDKYGIVAVNLTKFMLKEILPMKYDDITCLFNNLYVIKNDDKYAIFDTKILEKPVFEYDDVKVKYSDSKKIYVKKDKKWHYLTDNYNNSKEKNLTVGEIVSYPILLPFYILFCDWNLPSYTPKTINIKE